MVFPFKIGLKLYSTDISLIPEAFRHRGRFFNFIELYIVPGSYKETINVWKKFGIPFVIHTPHSAHGVNFAQKDKWETNLKHFNETRLFADELGSDTIIVHGGNNGSITETIRQLKSLNEWRIALENKPKIGLQGELCIGWSADEFHKAVSSGAVNKTVLDFAHAACAAYSMKVNEKGIIREFMTFNPNVFHLSDGYTSSESDIHLNLGKGDLNLTEFVSMIPNGSLVTIETPRNELGGPKDFSEDIYFLHHLLSKQHWPTKIEQSLENK